MEDIVQDGYLWQWITETGKWKKTRLENQSNHVAIKNQPLLVERGEDRREPHLVPEDMFFLHLEPPSAQEWLIKDIWVDKSRGFIAGNPGVGKTWFSLALCISVVTGRPFLDKFEVPKQGKVLLVEEEASRKNLKRRIDSMIQGMQLSDDEITRLAFFYHLTRKFVKIPEHEREIIRLIKENGITLLLFDSFRRIHNRKENSSDEMQEVLESLARIQDATDTNIILIHHLKKDPLASSSSSVFERMRGTSDLWAWRDCIIGLEGEDESDKVKCVFQFREDAEPSSFCVVRETMPENGILLRVEELEEQASFKEIIRGLRNHMQDKDPASKHSIIEAIEGRRKTKFEAFNYCLRKAYILKNNDNKYSWNVVPEFSGTDGNHGN